MKSKYDIHFVDDPRDNTFLKCVHCKEDCKTRYKKTAGNTTSGLRRHLENSHKEIYEELVNAEAAEKEAKAKAKRPNQTLFGQPVLKQTKLETHVTQWPNDSEKSVKLDELILQLLIEQTLPVTFVESEAFRNTLKFLTNGKYHLRGRKHFSNYAIPRAYEKQKQKISKALSLANYVAFTADGWSSKACTHSLLGITAHWLTEDFESRRCVIGTMPVKGSANAVNYLSLVQESMSDLNIEQSKVQCLVRDGASVMASLAQMLNVDSVHCFAHRLQLVVNRLLAKVPDWAITYNKMRKICKFMHKSKLAKESFVAVLEINDLPLRLLSKDTPVRWASTYLMCERFVEARVAVEHLLVEFKKKKKLPALEEEDWNKMEILKKVLAPFASATKTVQNAGNASISVIIPFVRVLGMGCEANRRDCNYSQLLYDALNTEMYSYLKMEQLQIATILDPRFKLSFLPHDDISLAQGRLETLVFNLINKENEETPIPLNTQEIRTALNNNQNENIFNIFLSANGDIVRSSPDLPESELRASALREVQQYLSERGDISVDPLNYWKINKKRFPNLAILARKYLCIPSTSAESERVFSAARRILTDYRLRMDPATLQQQLFLTVNASIFYDSTIDVSACTTLDDTD